jgi:UTP-glucose-1-phosphate uridylyltransferase
MQQKELTLLVMAAGIGSRYGGLKQIDPVGPSGEIILDYSVYDALQAGFTKVVFIISKTIEVPFRERIDRTIARHCQAVNVFQRLEDVPQGFTVPVGRLKPWGTGQAVLSSRSEVASPFAVINADDFYGRSSYHSIANYLRKAQDRDGKYDGCMIGFRLDKTLTEHGYVARGVCTLGESGELLNVIERTRIERDGLSARFTVDGQHWVPLALDSLVSMNIWGFTPAIFTALEERFPRFLVNSQANIEKAEYYLPNVVGDLVREKLAHVAVLPTQEKWHGVTYPQDKADVKAAILGMVQQGIYPQNLWPDS